MAVSLPGVTDSAQPTAQPVDPLAASRVNVQAPQSHTASASETAAAMKADSVERESSAGTSDYRAAVGRLAATCDHAASTAGASRAGMTVAAAPPAVKPNAAPAKLTANVKQADSTGRAATTGLSQVRAIKIEVKFRTAVSEVPNALHAYIEITRANGFKQDLAAYPVGGFAQTGEGGQLQFSAGNEKQFAKSAGPVEPFELHPPQGSSLTAYANALVDGAKSYNAHAVRYDGLGQQSDRFNSNSFVSSLIVAKGGTNGLNDVRDIASKLDAGPVTLPGQSPALNDRAMAERVRIDAESHRSIATGFGNARIEPHRFERSTLSAATPPPTWQDTKDVTAGGPAVVRAIWDRVFGKPQASPTPSH